MSKQDRPHEGSSGNAETRSGLPGTSGGLGVAQCLSVAERVAVENGEMAQIMGLRP